MQSKFTNAELTLRDLNELIGLLMIYGRQSEENAILLKHLDEEAYFKDKRNSLNENTVE